MANHLLMPVSAQTYSSLSFYACHSINVLVKGSSPTLLPFENRLPRRTFTATAIVHRLSFGLAVAFKTWKLFSVHEELSQPYPHVNPSWVLNIDSVRFAGALLTTPQSIEQPWYKINKLPYSFICSWSKTTFLSSLLIYK